MSYINSTYLINEYLSIQKNTLETLINSCKSFPREHISCNPNIKEWMIEEYKEELIWWRVCINPSFTMPLIKKYLKYCIFWFLSENINLTSDFISEYKDELQWFLLSRNPWLNTTYNKRNMKKR